MKKTTYAKIALSIALACSLSIAQGASRYVTDEFRVMLRSGESNSHKILRQLPSGEKVELIGSNAETGYSEVRTGDGTMGYILTHQLMDMPSARDRLAKAEARVKELEAAPGALSAKLAELQDAHKKLTAEHVEVSARKAELEQELENIRRTAADSLRMAEERTALRKSVADLTRETEDLKQENLDLRNKDVQSWFLVGAGVTVLGILIGLILPRLRVQRRRDSWGSL